MCSRWKRCNFTTDILLLSKVKRLTDMTINQSTEFDEALNFEQSLKEKMAAAPHMSQTRLVFAEMIVLCMTYRDLLEQKMSSDIEGEEYGSF